MRLGYRFEVAGYSEDFDRLSQALRAVRPFDRLRMSGRSAGKIDGPALAGWPFRSGYRPGLLASEKAKPAPL
jgi:hypothetical protein